MINYRRFAANLLATAGFGARLAPVFFSMNPIRSQFVVGFSSRFTLGLFLAVSMTGISRGEGEPERPLKPLVIHALPEAPWGGSIKDVEKVLNSSAGTLWRYFPQRELKPVLVDPQGGPVTLFDRGPAGEFQVRLDTGDRRWAQHAFQFAHEFGHILCGYRKGPDQHRWFEESLCEVASLFALRRMSESWQTAPPYPNWKDYSSSLGSYAGDRLKGARLAPGETLAAWYRKRAGDLALNPTRRELNLIVASVLLPLFERQPEHWEAVARLNGDGALEAHSFAEYLNQWYRNCPVGHRNFVEEVAGQFEIILPLESDSERDRINSKYDREVESLTSRIEELRRQRDAELKRLFELRQKQRAAGSGTKDAKPERI